MAAWAAPQTRPFLLYPADWELDLGPLIGAPMVYQQLRRWMERELGMSFGLTKAAAERSTPGSTPERRRRHVAARRFHAFRVRVARVHVAARRPISGAGAACRCA